MRARPSSPPCPSYLNALAGDGVHVVTVNDYLAERDSEWMGRIHRFLGLEVGVILANMTPAERRAAYAADITYGTNNEFGFDYLRDNMAWSKSEMVQRGHHFAVVDEVDSILIDEARTPLIISGPADNATTWYAEFARIAGMLKRDEDYEVDEKKKNIGVLEEAIDKVEDQIGIDNLYDTVNTPLVGFLNNAIRAKELFKKDRDYVVMNGEVIIVDEHTGRILPGRRYNEGLHQSIEAKEGVEVKAENQTLATVTLQNFFRLYKKLSGMTGTAMTEAAEFNQIYNLGVVPIPTNRPMVRIDNADLVYRTADAKYAAVIEDIAERHAHGQPILVGTTSVEKSETLSRLLKQSGVPHEVLNAKHHEREAAIVAQAGRRGAVTVATNMAGRGTDIILGGNPEFMAAAALSQQGLSPIEDPEAYEAAWPDAIEKSKASVQDRARGGHRPRRALRPRHRAARVPPHRQPAARSLRPSGRSGRDAVLPVARGRPHAAVQVRHGRCLPAPVQRPRRRADRGEDGHQRHQVSAQSQVEAQNFEIRKDVLKYDDVLNRQRLVDLRRAASGDRGRGHPGPGPHLHHRHGHRLRARPPPPRATPSRGTSTSCGPRSSSSTRSA